jgi:uncharacterized protein (TIGR03437 family)
VVTLNIFATSAQGLTGSATITAGLTSGTTPVIGAISDSATLQSKSFSPGSYLTIFGSNLANTRVLASTVPLPTTLGRSSVSVGGKLLPLIYVSPGQINAILPYSLAVNSSQPLIVANGTLSARPQPLQPPRPTQESLQLTKTAGCGHALNQDFTLNSPASSGPLDCLHILRGSGVKPGSQKRGCTPTACHDVECMGVPTTST